MAKVVNKLENFSAFYTSQSTRKNGTKAAAQTGSQGGNLLSTVTYGDNYKDFRQRIALGQNATTTLSGRKYRQIKGIWGFRAKRPGPYDLLLPTALVSCEGAGTARILPPVSPLAVSSAAMVRTNNEAISRYVKKAIETRRSFQGGVFLGELREAIRMIKRPAQSLRRGLDDYLSTLKKRKKIVRGSGAQRERNADRVVADTWLEYSFGWLPLVGDIDDAARTLANHFYGDDRPHDKEIAGFSEHIQHEKFANPEWVSGPLEVGFPARQETRYSVRYYGKIRVTHPTRSTWGRWGFTPENLVPTAWELLPWSFLVDYFTNIGDLITCASAVTSDVSWTARTIRHGTYIVSDQPYYIGNLGWQGQVFGSPASASVTDVSRIPYNGQLIPSLHFTVPGSGVKWINMAALTASARRLLPFF